VDRDWWQAGRPSALRFRVAGGFQEREDGVDGRQVLLEVIHPLDGMSRLLVSSALTNPVASGTRA
jgi:hypothetical protein